jgi:hypothetical protein
MGGMAAEAPATGGNDALLTLIGAIVVAAIGAAATVIVAALGRNKTETSPPSAASPGFQGGDLQFRDYVVGELAVLKSRADDSDDRDEYQDRRLEQIERHKDHEQPGWRSP